ncbi:MAG: hypothetical protein PHY47_09650 [Lachnospiraceae bacterium]|nr:hypothetical protein [Lachnospiraceae bacterium]
MTGENYRRFIGNGNSRINEIKEKIQELKNECGKLLNVNEIDKNGFNEIKYDKLCKEIEWQEYLLWGARNNMKTCI